MKGKKTHYSNGFWRILYIRESDVSENTKSLLWPISMK